MHTDINLIIGIDQTGAINHKGMPKGLPFVALHKNRPNRWALRCSKNKGKYLNLKSFSKESLENLLVELEIEIQTHKVLIAVDAVFGLPISAEIDFKYNAMFLKKIFEKTQNFPGYGLKIGQSFFDCILKELFTEHSIIHKDFPKRRYETILNANSVFTHMPAQKNIQTGTYRIWKDLSKWNPQSYRLWPFDNIAPSSNKPAILEAYPSLAWSILNQSNRSANDFSKTFSKFEPLVSNIEDFAHYPPDHKDAAFIALLSLWYIVNEISFFPQKIDVEGHILGANYQDKGDPSHEKKQPV